MKTARCPICRKSKPVSSFYRNKARKSGTSVRCKPCTAAYEASPDRRAKRTWNTIRARTRLQSSYRGIEVRMTRSKYLEWAIPAYTEWMTRHPDETPSIDRIDPTKHYEIGNLQIIERGENCRRASNHPNVHASTGMAWCHVCKDHLPVNKFWRSSGNYNGLQKRCKDCQTAAILRSAQSDASAPF